MKTLLIDILHIFILAMMGGFVILLISTIMGSSKVWAKRYIRNRPGRRISPDQSR